MDIVSKTILIFERLINRVTDRVTFLSFINDKRSKEDSTKRIEKGVTKGYSQTYHLFSL